MYMFTVRICFQTLPEISAPAVTIIQYINRRTKAITKNFSPEKPCFLPFFAEKLSFLRCMPFPAAIFMRYDLPHTALILPEKQAPAFQKKSQIQSTPAFSAQDDAIAGRRKSSCGGTDT